MGSFSFHYFQAQEILAKAKAIGSLAIIYNVKIYLSVNNGWLGWVESDKSCTWSGGNRFDYM